MFESSRAAVAGSRPGVISHRSRWPTGLSNPAVLLRCMATISLKVTSVQARLIEKAARESAFPSKSEFVRYAIARALEDTLSVGTLEEIFEARRQVRAGRTVSLKSIKSTQ
jgi:Arc/MetJ-type ribon-helix-helix transcriptional regulator